MKARNVLVAVVIAACLVMGSVGPSLADTYNGSGKAIMLVDGKADSDTQVTAKVTDYSFPNTSSLSFQINGAGSWTSIACGLGVATTLGTYQGGDHIVFKVSYNNADYLSTNSKFATITYHDSFANPGEKPIVVPYYERADILWSIGGISFRLDVLSTENPVSGDNGVAPVPLPEAFWLLGSGLIALVGIRRKAFFG
jgi:hypothetical protein